MTTEILLSATELVTRVHQADGSIAEAAVDAAGKLVRKTDEIGITHRYGYDALGRLMRVETPDGAQTLRFDGFGRPAHMIPRRPRRDPYRYHPVTGLLVHKELRTPSGTLVRACDTTYDAFGRIIGVTHTAPGDASQLTFDLDGQLGNGVTVPGQLGQLTHVAGDGWSRSVLVDPLGRAYEEHLEADRLARAEPGRLARSSSRCILTTATGPKSLPLALDLKLLKIALTPRRTERT